MLLFPNLWSHRCRVSTVEVCSWPVEKPASRGCTVVSPGAPPSLKQRRSLAPRSLGTIELCFTVGLDPASFRASSSAAAQQTTCASTCADANAPALCVIEVLSRKYNSFRTVLKRVTLTNLRGDTVNDEHPQFQEVSARCCIKYCTGCVSRPTEKGIICRVWQIANCR